MTSIEHIDSAVAIDLGRLADKVFAGAQVQSAGMVDIDFSMFYMLGLFLVFAVLMHYLLFKPLIASQEARFKGMGGAREDASSYELRAAEAQLAYERRLTKARQDAVKIRDEIKKQATETAQEHISAMQGASDQQVEAAKGQLSLFAQQARAEMKVHADALATELSARIIGGKA